MIKRPRFLTNSVFSQLSLQSRFLQNPGASRIHLLYERPPGIGNITPPTIPCRGRSQAATPAAAWTSLVLLLWVCLFSVVMTGCNEGKADPKAEAPPKAVVEPDLDANNFKVDHPEQFPLATAVEHKAVPALNVTGVVQPDISRAVPVISLASGRVVEIKARLGDVVTKGQLLLRVRSNDVSGAYQVYLKAVNDERRARLQVERARDLYAKGATSRGLLEQAEDAEQDAKVDLDTAT